MLDVLNTWQSSDDRWWGLGTKQTCVKGRRRWSRSYVHILKWPLLQYHSFCHSAPVSAAISPSELFVCTSNSAWSSALKLSVHAYPAPKTFSGVSNCYRHDDTVLRRRFAIICQGTLSLTTLSERLLSLILSDRPSTDIVHFMANPSFELSSVYSIVQNTFTALESSHFPAQDWHARIAGILLELYQYAWSFIYDQWYSSDYLKLTELDPDDFL